MLTIDPELKKCFSTQSPLFDQIMALRGKVFRELENRRTQQVMLGNKSYFVKQHFGVGWKEIFKNLFQLRWPILSAKNEWQALNHLKQLPVKTQEVVGYGCRGWNPAKLQSFLITRELPSHISLEDFCKNWQSEPPSFQQKRQLILEVARITRTLHENGINHRDFYICHFLLDKQSLAKGDKIPEIYVIDFHRAGLRQHIPSRWIIKDLAGLYFSSKDCGITQRDLLRFMKEYRNKSLGLILTKEAAFWQRVKTRGDKLYQQHAN